MKTLLAAFAKNTVFANIIIILIFLGGYFAVSTMIKEVYPELSLGVITISILFPGGNPEEIEEGICLKLEEAISKIEGVHQFTTKASENIGSARVELKNGYHVDTVIEHVKVAVDSITTFPDGAEKPVIKEFIFKEPVIHLAVSGDMSERRLKTWADSLKEELRHLPDVSQVEVFGVRDYEIDVEISEQRLHEYGLTFELVADAINRSSLNLSGGTIRDRGEEIRIKTVGRKYSGRELASVVILAGTGGKMVTLDHIAEIKDGFSEDMISATVNGKPSLIIIINKTNEEDIIAISEQVNKFVKEKHKVLPEGVELKILYDNTEKLRSRLSLLTKNGIMGMIIVFLLLWIFLNARLSFWAGMGIPVSIAGGLTILWGYGGTVNMISLFALIMVLGIVVDDAIIVGEAVFVHKKMGKTGLQAAVDGVSEVGLPIVAAIATTIVAFSPLMFVNGSMGKLIGILPVVVIACLIVSLAECLFILPAHLSHLPDSEDGNYKSNKLTRRLTRVNKITASCVNLFIYKYYTPFLSWVLRWRYVALSIAISLILLGVGVMKGGLLKFEVFPEIDGYIMTATVEFPDGTSPEITEKAVEKIEAALNRLNKKIDTTSGDPLLKDLVALVGQTFGGRGTPLRGSNYGAVQAILLNSEYRGIHTKDLIVEWEKETGLIAGVKSIKFTGMKAGPPGDPIEVWIQGESMDNIIAAGNQLMDRLSKFEGVFQIHSDFSIGKREIQLTLKPEARTLGLTVDDLAKQIYAGYYGREVMRLQRGKDDVRVRVRYTSEERNRITNLENVSIRTKNGVGIPLNSVADLRFVPGYSTIIRTDGMRRIAIFAGVNTSTTNANEIFDELVLAFFPEIKKRFPSVSIALQGEHKKVRESIGSLVIGFPLALLGIFTIIATTFRSYIQPLIIMITIPFGIIGALIGHLLLGYDLSIMSIFGMVALTGVVVNDAIVYIEKVNENLATGMRFFHSVIKGCTRRFMAIFLTTISTVGGLMPLILESDFQAKFLIPMALSIAAGVAFATFLTLILVPCFLVILNDLRMVLYRYRNGCWAEREVVEPAFKRNDTPENKEDQKVYNIIPHSARKTTGTSI